jgi:hypothetical protein
MTAKHLYSGSELWKELGAEIEQLVGFKKPPDAEQVAIVLECPDDGCVAVNFYNERKWQIIGNINDFLEERREQFDRLREIFGLPKRTLNIEIMIPLWEAVPEVTTTYHPIFDFEEAGDDR